MHLLEDHSLLMPQETFENLVLHGGAASTSMEHDPASRFGHSAVNKGKGKAYSKRSGERFSKGGAKGASNRGTNTSTAEQALRTYTKQINELGKRHQLSQASGSAPEFEPTIILLRRIRPSSLTRLEEVVI